MISERLKKFFASDIRSRGETYARSGHVKDFRVTADRVESVVVGSDEYDVWMDRLDDAAGGWKVEVGCSCPFADGHRTCKHIWATVIAAEARIDRSWGPPPPVVRLGDQESSPADDLVVVRREGNRTILRMGERGPHILVSGDFERLLKKPLVQLPPAVPHPRKPKIPAWKRMLDESRMYHDSSGPAHHAKAEPPITSPIRYIVDAHRSHAQHALIVDLWTEPDAAARRPTQGKKLPISVDSVTAILNERDREICALLVGAARPNRQGNDYAHDSRSQQRAALWQVNPRLIPVVLPMMSATGRLMWRREESGAPAPAVWAPDKPWDLIILLRESAKRPGSMVVSVGVRREDTALGVDEVHAVVEGDPGAAIVSGEIAPLRIAGGYAAGAYRWAQSLRWRPEITVQAAEVGAFMEALEERGISLPVVWPEGWGPRRITGVPCRPRLVLRKPDEKWRTVDHLQAALLARYDQSEVSIGAGQFARASHPDGAEHLIARDTPAEAAAGARFMALGGVREKYENALYVPVKRVPEMAAALLAEGWEVVGAGAAYRRPGEVHVRISSGIDWFDVHGKIDFGETTADMASVLDALRKGERFVSLGDGSLGLLPDEWLRKHGRWLSLGRAEGGGVRFSRAQIALVDALMAQMPEARCDKQVSAARKRLSAFDGIKPVAEPKGFKGELRPYQRQGLGWLRFLAEFGLGGCLADDMGLGKTVQLLAHVLDRRVAGEKGPWLVVAPKSLVFNWAREAARFAPGLAVLDHTGNERHDRVDAIVGADLVLTTYATMRLDIDKLREVEFACVVLDEAQAIKNADAQSAKAARLLRAGRRLALTGTPVENRLEDLWSIFEFVNPGMLGSLRAFQGAWRSGPEGGPGLDVLRRALRPFLLRRTKATVAPELPMRSEQTIRCELEGKQRTLYDGLRKHYRDQLLGRVDRDGINKSKMHVLEALLRLRQAACHPGLIEPKGNAPSAKVETLVDMLEELAQEGHKALVFSQFTSLLALVRAELDRKSITYEQLDGSTPASERRAAVDRFQSTPVRDGGRPVFLISLKAGGVGLNLTAAGYVFLLDPWWNPAVEAQAIDRTHRIGQDKSVIAYRLIATGTVEERILEMQAGKRELAEAIVSENDGPLAAMTREDLEWLLS